VISTDETETQPELDELGPLRRCIATGERLEPGRMIRFVVGPEDRLVPDVAGKLPGRGIWVSAERNALERAVAKRLFARAARRAITVEPGIAGEVERLIERQCLDLLGLANRAGQVAAGFDRVATSLKRGRTGALIEACDGAPEGRTTLRAMAGDVPVVSLFPAAALAEALGREGGVIVHAAIRAGTLAERFVEAAHRLAGLRGTA
jgi:uncharacterized protein